MKQNLKLACIITLLTLAANISSSFAQTKADIFDDKTPVTWLGIDFSQTRFVGTASMFANGGQMTNAEFRDIMTRSWNELFINEPKKYDVAKALHRTTVTYAIDVAEKANAALASKDFFTNNPGDFKTLNEAAIGDVVKNYDFQGHEGIGLIFFVEGMSKGQKATGLWVTFVDMKSKTVLLTKYVTQEPGGFGFRNYWAKPFYITLKKLGSDYYSDWKKGK